MIAVEVLYANGTNAWIGHFGNIASARQSMMDHARINELPDEAPWHGPDMGILEGWFVRRDEYLLHQVTLNGR
jgi:hypothetical protein